MAVFERKRYAHNRLIQQIARASVDWGDLVLRHPAYNDVLKVAMGRASIKERLGVQDARANIKRVIWIIHDALGEDLLMQLAIKSVANLVIEGHHVIQQHLNDTRTTGKDLQTSLLVNVIAADVKDAYKECRCEATLKEQINSYLGDLTIPDIYRDHLFSVIQEVIVTNKSIPHLCRSNG